MTSTPPPAAVRDDVAPGGPGIEPRWTSSAKSGVGTAMSALSRVWFTISHGILNEIYYPRVDQANTRDFGLLVTDGSSFFSEEKRHTMSEVALLVPGVPAYRITNTSVDGRYRITKTIITDPERDVLLQEVVFDALHGELSDYRLFALLAPHLGNQGHGNDGWAGDYKGVPMLFAQRGPTALALASSAGWAAMSCGYVGATDGWQQIHEHKRLVRCDRRATNGNIALTGEVDLAGCGGRFVLALAFGTAAAEAGEDARAALMQAFGAARDAFVSDWQRFHRKTRNPRTLNDTATAGYMLSVAVLHTHEDKGHPGALIASLSIPWGNNKGDRDLGGYHLVWPRDLVESAGALVACGHTDSARRSLRYLMATQDADGHWPQNMWLDGTKFWLGTQLDETGFPILLAGLLRRRRALGSVDPWPAMRRAAAYLVRNGPVTPEDRWEEDGGYSPFTIAVEVAALLTAAELAEDANEADVARYLRDTADIWNDSIERWTYVTDTPLSRKYGVEGYYLRIAPSGPSGPLSGQDAVVSIKNHPRDQSRMIASELVSTDALALVRFGLRRSDDPRIVNTARVIDALLCSSTATGPAWHRYNADGYGEHDDGSPFDGTGIGRGWPLLAGERAHYELAAGRMDDAERLLHVMRNQTSPGGLLPEQIWDASSIPERELFNGHPSGSAMPLVWAHAEYVKLVHSLADGSVFDTPPETVERYLRAHRVTGLASWRFNSKRRSIPAGKTLRIETLAPARIHWSADGWNTSRDTDAVDTTLGVWYADLTTDALGAGAEVCFTFYWPKADRWEGRNFTVAIT